MVHQSANPGFKQAVHISYSYSYHVDLRASKDFFKAAVLYCCEVSEKVLGMKKLPPTSIDMSREWLDLDFWMKYLFNYGPLSIHPLFFPVVYH